MVQFSHHVSDRFVLFSLTQGDTASDNQEHGAVVVKETDYDETGGDETRDEVIIEKEDERESVLGSRVQTHILVLSESSAEITN